VMALLCTIEELVAAGAWVNEFRVVHDEPFQGEFYLHFRAGVLRLCRNSDRRGVFVRPEEIVKRLKGDFLLGRACGIRRGIQLDILDATSGLGLDGLALASTGQRVVMVERERALWALLVNLLERIDPDQAELVLDDCGRVLANTGRPSPDVVYFDPMFPPRSKSALPGKRMQYLIGLLAGMPPFDEGLIDLARTRARSRVVLKRRLKDRPIGRPDWAIKGRSVRYDVYRGSG